MDRLCRSRERTRFNSIIKFAFDAFVPSLNQISVNPGPVERTLRFPCRPSHNAAIILGHCKQLSTYAIDLTLNGTISSYDSNCNFFSHSYLLYWGQTACKPHPHGITTPLQTWLTGNKYWSLRSRKLDIQHRKVEPNAHGESRKL